MVRYNVVGNNCNWYYVIIFQLLIAIMRAFIGVIMFKNFLAVSVNSGQVEWVFSQAGKNFAN